MRSLTRKMVNTSEDKQTHTEYDRTFNVTTYAGFLVAYISTDSNPGDPVRLLIV